MVTGGEAGRLTDEASREVPWCREASQGDGCRRLVRLVNPHALLHSTCPWQNRPSILGNLPSLAVLRRDHDIRRWSGYRVGGSEAGEDVEVYWACSSQSSNCDGITRAREQSAQKPYPACSMAPDGRSDTNPLLTAVASRNDRPADLPGTSLGNESSQTNPLESPAGRSDGHPTPFLPKLGTVTSRFSSSKFDSKADEESSPDTVKARSSSFRCANRCRNCSPILASLIAGVLMLALVIAACTLLLPDLVFDSQPILDDVDERLIAQALQAEHTLHARTGGGQVEGQSFAPTAGTGASTETWKKGTREETAGAAVEDALAAAATALASSDGSKVGSSGVSAGKPADVSISRNVTWISSTGAWFFSFFRMSVREREKGEVVEIERIEASGGGRGNKRGWRSGSAGSTDDRIGGAEVRETHTSASYQADGVNRASVEVTAGRDNVVAEKGLRGRPAEVTAGQRGWLGGGDSQGSDGDGLSGSGGGNGQDASEGGRTRKIALMFLIRSALPLREVWERFLASHHGSYSLYLHASSPDFSLESLRLPEGSVFREARVVERTPVTWGGMSMVRATRRLLATALQDTANERFVLLSESCAPIHGFKFVHDYLFMANKSFVRSLRLKGGWRYPPGGVVLDQPYADVLRGFRGAEGREGEQKGGGSNTGADSGREGRAGEGEQEGRGGEREGEAGEQGSPVVEHGRSEEGGRLASKEDRTLPISDFRKGSQWFALTRPHALLVVKDQVFYEAFVRSSVSIPDESYVQTIVPLMDGANVERRTLTYVEWPAVGIHQHPVRFYANMVTAQRVVAIQQMHIPLTETVGTWGREYEGEGPCHVGGELASCYLFVRKFGPDAVQPLLQLGELLGY